MGRSSYAAAYWPRGGPAPRLWPGAFPTQAPPLRHSVTTFLPSPPPLRLPSHPPAGFLRLEVTLCYLQPFWKRGLGVKKLGFVPVWVRWSDLASVRLNSAVFMSAHCHGYMHIFVHHNPANKCSERNGEQAALICLLTSYVTWKN